MIILKAPSSKSLSHRALIASALSHGKSELYNLLDCDDTRITMAILGKIGAKFLPFEKGIFKDFIVEGIGDKVKNSTILDAPLECFMGESGTSARLLTAVLAYGKGYFKINGSQRMNERPMRALIQALRSIGAEIIEEKEGFTPFIIHAKKLKGGRCEISLDESSQYLSALLLLAPLCEEGLTIYPIGKKVVSWPYVALTLQTLEAFGIDFTVKNKDASIIHDWSEMHEIKANSLYIEVKKGQYKSGIHRVEGDWSSASYLLAAGAIGKHPVKVNGLNINSPQGDKIMLSILQQMGAKIEIGINEIKVFPSKLQGIEVDMNACPDIVPTVALLAACAENVTKIVNVPHLRIKESDRIASISTELNKIGVKTKEFQDGIEIYGNGSMPQFENEIHFSAHNDHRIAMSMSLFALHGGKIKFDDKEVVKKSFPEYWQIHEKLIKTYNMS